MTDHTNTANTPNPDRAVIDRALSLLVHAARVSPPLREAVATVEAALNADEAPFVLDRTGNPHPRMLAEAWELRTAAEGVIGLPGKGAAQVLGEWHGYLRCMCAATGETPEAITAWMERNG